MTTARDAPPQPHPSVETAFLPPEAVLWDGRHAEVHHLNPSASAVWLLIDGELTREQIASELSDIFEVPFDVVRPDVDAAIDEFVRNGLLAAADDTDGDADEHDHHHHHHHHHHGGDLEREFRHRVNTHDHTDATTASGEVDAVTTLPRPPDP